MGGGFDHEGSYCDAFSVFRSLQFSPMYCVLIGANKGASPACGDVSSVENLSLSLVTPSLAVDTHDTLNTTTAHGACLNTGGIGTTLAQAFVATWNYNISCSFRETDDTRMLVHGFLMGERRCCRACAAA